MILRGAFGLAFFDLSRFLTLPLSLFEFEPLRVAMLLPTHIDRMSGTVAMSVEASRGYRSRRSRLRVSLLCIESRGLRVEFRSHGDLFLYFSVDQRVSFFQA